MKEKLVALGWPSSPISRALQVSQSRICNSDLMSLRCGPTCGGNNNHLTQTVLPSKGSYPKQAFLSLGGPWVKGEMVCPDLMIQKNPDRYSWLQRKWPSCVSWVKRHGRPFLSPGLLPDPCLLRFESCRTIEGVLYLRRQNWKERSGHLGSDCIQWLDVVCWQIVANTGPSPPQTLRVHAAGQNDPPAASKPDIVRCTCSSYQLTHSS